MMDPSDAGETTDAQGSEVSPSPVETTAIGASAHALSGPAPSTDWTLPVRAAPILLDQGEQVVEFPLSQHRTGRSSTSLVMDDHLLRLVEARLDDDGIRRLDVRMALVKAHLSGYSHTHLDLFQRMMPVWWTSLAAGLLMSTGLIQGWLALSGGLFAFAGVAGMLLAKLDLHRLSFSDHGGRHDFYLSGWGEDPQLIRNSMALLGPAFVDFLRGGELETTHIDAVVASLSTDLKTTKPLPVNPEALPDATRSQPVPADPATSPPEVVRPDPGVSQPMPSVAPQQQVAAPIQETPAVTLPVQPPPPGPPVNPPGPPASLPAPLPPPPARASLPPPNPPVLPPAPLPPMPLTPTPPIRSAEDALWDDLV